MANPTYQYQKSSQHGAVIQEYLLGLVLLVLPVATVQALLIYGAQVRQNQAATAMAETVVCRKTTSKSYPQACRASSSPQDRIKQLEEPTQ